MSKDLFSTQSDIYARYRPTYPAEMIDYILQFVHERDAAWDCATGNGQAALLLANHFRKVYATDISERQLSNAVKNDKIVYSTSAAEETSFPDKLFDLVTVAQGYHWFDFDKFEKEVHRVMKPSGVVAIWGYALVKADNEKIDDLIKAFYKDTVGRYWDPERKYVDDHYTTVPFPYGELPGRSFTINVEWTITDLAGYLNTWSSVQHYIRENSHDPVDPFIKELEKTGVPGKLKFQFPVFLRLGRVKPGS